METEVITRVQWGDAEELARKIGAIEEVAGGTVGPALQATLPAEATTEPPPAPRPKGLIDVGEAAGKHGEEVEVEIRGHCDVPVMGFAAAIGFESRDLKFLAVEWPAIWGIADGAEVLLAEARDRDDGNAGNAGPCVLLNIARFDIRSTAPGATGSDAGVLLAPVMLPQGSLLATLKFKILNTARVGRVIPLLNRSRLFGKPRVIAEFTTYDSSKPDQKAMGPSVEPELDGGRIVVTG